MPITDMALLMCVTGTVLLAAIIMTARWSLGQHGDDDDVLWQPQRHSSRIDHACLEQAFRVFRTERSP